MFFTDHLQLCQDRAVERFKNGLHLVKPDVIEKMYNNTIPLLKVNFQAIDRLVMLDARKTNEVSLQGIYSKAAENIKIYDEGSSWFKNDVLPFIHEQLSIKRFENPYLKNWDDSELGPSR